MSFTPAVLALLPLLPPQEARPPLSPAPPTPVAARRPVRPFLALVPADAVLLAATDELDAIRARAEANAWWRMLTGPELRPTWDWVRDAVEIDVGEPGFDPFSVPRAIHGRTAYFLVLEEGGAPGFGLVVEPGADRAAFDALVGRALAAAEQELTVERVPAGGVEILLGAAQESPDEDEPDHFALVDLEDATALLAAGGRERVLELAQGVVARARGADASAGLLASERFLAARAASSVKDGALELFVDLGRLLDLAAADPELSPARAVMDEVGFGALEWSYFAADVGAGERLDLELSLPRPRAGVLGQLVDRFGEVTPELARWAPRDALAASYLVFDAWGAWQDVWAFLEAEYPDQHALGRIGLESAMQPLGIDLEADFLAELTGEWAAFSVPVPEAEWRAATGAGLAVLGMSEVGLEPLGEVLLVGLRDTETVRLAALDVIEEALAGFGAEVETEERDGVVVHSLGGPMGGVHWAFTADRLVVSQFPTALAAGLAAAEAEDGDGVLGSELLGPPLARLLGSAGASAQSSRSFVKELAAVASMAAGVQALDGGGTPPVPGCELVEAYLSGVLTSAVRLSPRSITVRWSAR